MQITSRDLDHVLARMAAGDLAVLHTFIRLWGAPVADILSRCGVPDDELDELVQQVADELFDRAEQRGGAAAPGWFAVEHASAAVVAANGYQDEFEPNGAAVIHRCPDQDRRALHLVDIENFGGGLISQPGRVTEVLCEYQTATPVGLHDQVYIACDINLYKRVAFDAVGCRVLPGYGENGADNALLDVMAPAQIAQRFDRVVIGSGDGIFAELATELRTAGLTVIVVSRPECLSRALEAAADEARRLRSLEPLPLAQSRPRPGRHLPAVAHGSQQREAA